MQLICPLSSNNSTVSLFKICVSFPFWPMATESSASNFRRRTIDLVYRVSYRSSSTSPKLYWDALWSVAWISVSSALANLFQLATKKLPNTVHSLRVLFHKMIFTAFGRYMIQFFFPINFCCVRCKFHDRWVP
jgi:hypothetical protein